MSRPAGFATAVRSQASMEARLTARRAENLLAMIGIPAAVLTFFGTVGVGGIAGGVPRLLPPTLALAIVASGLVNLGIATAYERGYGVLKRLGGAPLGRAGLLTAKLVVVGTIAVLQVVALIALAAVLGWRAGPSASWLGVALATFIGVAAFAGLGLLLAGSLRPEATLVLANAFFLAAILLGGVFVPVGDLPGPLGSLAALLPVGALTEAYDHVLTGQGDVVRPIVLLAAWALGAFALAARTFRWE
jgi:ABC-2 type transport system permease protein